MCGRFQMTPEAWSAASRLASIPSFIEIPRVFNSSYFSGGDE